MAKTVNELLAEALANAQKHAIGNIVNSVNITAKQRTLLIKQGYFKKIIRGWYLLDGDLTAKSAGESALWHESLWVFIGQYITQKFGQSYILSPEASLDLLTGNNTVPKQLVVFIKDISPRKIALPNDISLLLIAASKPAYQTIEYHGVSLHSLESALVAVTPSAFRLTPFSLQIALQQADISELEKAIVSSKNQAAGNRLVGAYLELDMKTEAESLLGIMQSIGFQAIAPINPFDQSLTLTGRQQQESPSALRIRLLWQQMRQEVLNIFSDLPPPHQFHQRPWQAWQDSMQDLYVSDAYHSLSIEGYQVTNALIERIAQGYWSPDALQQDKNQRDALAAKGYHDAFNQVRALLKIAHQDGEMVLQDYLDRGITSWYRALFQACVDAGLVSPMDLAGFRKGAIYIRGSMHTPPSSEQLMDCMTALKDLITQEESYVVKAILGHLFIGYIHPFPDGNGRTARFLMNFLLALGGYDWLIIRHETRDKYLESLEQASVYKNIRPFAEFIRDSMSR